jgi:leucyl aminopeptidase
MFAPLPFNAVVAGARGVVLLLGLAVGPLWAGEKIEFAGFANLPADGILVVPVASDLGLPAEVGGETRAAVERALKVAAFEAEKGATLPVYGVSSYDLVLLVGLGEAPVDASLLADTGGSIALQKPGGRGQPVHILSPAADDGSLAAARLALGLTLGGYAFAGYKSETGEVTDGAPVDTTYVIYTDRAAEAEAAWRGRGQPLADGVFFARDLISEPANRLYPEAFVARARAAFKGLDNVTVKALDVRQMEKLGLGALLGVGMGSERPPRLLLVEYRGGEKGAPPLAFVGKGVTFDSGGISIKGSRGLWKMKYDMSGAAAVTATLLALAKQQAPVNAVAVAALVENMPSGRAQRPGDVRTTLSGRTIEVINTDAEGRLILADAVIYAQQVYEPRLLVDVATLTGSVRIALGNAYAGAFSRHDDLLDELRGAGARAGEPVWPLPLHAAFQDALKSDIADIRNSAEGVHGGASIGAEMIGFFVDEKTRWAHIDIAGMAWEDKGKPTVPRGAVGFGVQLLNQLVLEHYAP